MIELFKIGFIKVSLIDIIDILLVTWIFYKVYQYFKETRAGQMLIGLIILLIASFLFNAFGISATSWLINQFQTIWVVAFVILFQPEMLVKLDFSVRYLELVQAVRLRQLSTHHYN